MNEYVKQNLWMMFKDLGSVSVTFVNDDGISEDIIYDNFEEAENDIRIREQFEEVYF